MKLRRLPPLHALEAFEVAARELSFRKAAEALHLTPSAVSHQIKGLEEFLGFALFRRLNRALELTEGGRDYLGVVQASLESLRAGSERTRQHHGRRAMLKLSVGPYLASEILVPALPSFQQEHPEIELSIETRVQPADLRREDLDIGVRFGGGRWPGLSATLLLEVKAVPVCSAAVAKTLNGRPPAELGDISLIHSTPLAEGWPQWAQLAGVTLGKPKNDLWLDSYFALLRAAEQGLGVALGMTPVINPWLRDGRLVLPWPRLRVRIPQAYYLVHRPGDEARHEVQAFGAWLSALLNRIPPA
jgi:LysR family transcriptional regulator, glycine cleavage system transcriptional activator